MILDAIFFNLRALSNHWAQRDTAERAISHGYFGRRGTFPLHTALAAERGNGKIHGIRTPQNHCGDERRPKQRPLRDLFGTFHVSDIARLGTPTQNRARTENCSGCQLSLFYYTQVNKIHKIGGQYLCCTHKLGRGSIRSIRSIRSML